MCSCFVQSLPCTMIYEEGTCFEGLHASTNGSWSCAAGAKLCFIHIGTLRASIHSCSLMFQHVLFCMCQMCACQEPTVRLKQGYSVVINSGAHCQAQASNHTCHSVIINSGAHCQAQASNHTCHAQLSTQEETQ